MLKRKRSIFRSIKNNNLEITPPEMLRAVYNRHIFKVPRKLLTEVFKHFNARFLKENQISEQACVEYVNELLRSWEKIMRFDEHSKNYVKVPRANTVGNNPDYGQTFGEKND